MILRADIFLHQTEKGGTWESIQCFSSKSGKTIQLI